MRKYLLWVVLLLGVAASLHAQQSPTTGNLTAASSSCLVTNCIQLQVTTTVGGATIQLSGTWSATVQFEATNDNVTWVAINVMPSNSSTAVSSATGNGIWQFNPAGYTNIRVRVSAYTSGTVVATAQLSNASARSNGGGGGGGSLTQAFLVQVADASLPNAQALGALATGLVKNTTATGVQSIGTSTDVIGLFTSCSGTQYLGADGACHTTGAITSSTAGQCAIYTAATTLAGSTPCAQDSSGAMHFTGTAANTFSDISLDGTGRIAFLNSFAQSIVWNAGQGRFDIVTSSGVNLSISAAGIISILDPIESDVAIFGATFKTTTNCGAVGTSANPSLVACGAAAAGAFSCATTASTGTCVVADTAVTAASEIFVNQVVSEGTRLSVTCNTGGVLPAGPLLLSKSAGVGFTVTLGTVTVNPGCFEFHIMN